MICENGHSVELVVLYRDIASGEVRYHGKLDAAMLESFIQSVNEGECPACNFFVSAE